MRKRVRITRYWLVVTSAPWSGAGASIINLSVKQPADRYFPAPTPEIIDEAHSMLKARGLQGRIWLSSDELATLMPRKARALRDAARRGELPAECLPHRRRVVWMFDLARVLACLRQFARDESLRRTK